MTHLAADDRDETTLIGVLRSGRLGSEDEVYAFEHDLASSFGCTAVTTSSGSTAIELVLRALRLGPSDRVAVPAYTCASVADAVRAAGCRPTFVDVRVSTGTMDPAALGAALDTGVRAVVAVDQYGRNAELARLAAMTQPRLIPLIHDVAASFGLDRRDPGPGIVRVASFHPSKVLAAGEGGVVLTSDPALADDVRYLRSPGALAVRGFAPPAGRVGAPGYSMRMSDLDAALGRARLTRLDSTLASFAAAAASYEEAFRRVSVPDVVLPTREGHAFVSYPVMLRDAATCDRFVELTARQGLEVRHAHRWLHECPGAVRVSSTTACLPTRLERDPGRDHAYAVALAAVSS